MTRIAATPSETSCIISNLFTELRPVCGFCEGDSVVLCGITYDGGVRPDLVENGTD